MSLASLATDVPSPIESPTWAAFRAGASFVPSPVTATTCPWRCRASTSRFLSIGRARAIIFRSITRSSSWLSVKAPNSGPVIMLRSVSEGCHNPICRPISFAVPGVSPVTILTFMPAFRTSSMAAGTSERTGSAIATMPRNSRLSAITLPSVIVASPVLISCTANPRVRMAWA